MPGVQRGIKFCKTCLGMSGCDGGLLTDSSWPMMVFPETMPDVLGPDVIVSEVSGDITDAWKRMEFLFCAESFMVLFVGNGGLHTELNFPTVLNCLSDSLSVINLCNKPSAFGITMLVEVEGLSGDGSTDIPVWEGLSVLSLPLRTVM